jgi:hypothetical protein
MNYDSDFYLQPFWVGGMEDVPQDFLAPYRTAISASPGSSCAFFVPRQNETINARGFETPRIFRVTPTELQVISRKGREGHAELSLLALSEILFHETGTSFLKSWFTVGAGEASISPDRRFGYRTTWDRFFDGLYSQLHRYWAETLERYSLDISGPRRRISELDPSGTPFLTGPPDPEKRVWVLYQEPRQHAYRGWLRKVKAAGRCLCVSDKFLFWFDEEFRGQIMEYGWVRRFIPLSRIESLGLSTAARGTGQRMDFRIGLAGRKTGSTFSVPVLPESAEHLRDFGDGWRNLNHVEA